MDLNFGPAKLTTAKRQRVSSYDCTGGNCDHWRLHPRQERLLLDTTGPGCIRHIWFTVGSDDPLHLRNIILRAWWDDEKTPSVLCPLGDFFGQSHGIYSLFDTPWLGASSKGGRALNCFFPMPFAAGAKISVENQADSGTPAYFYFYIDYETTAVPADIGRFHAHWRRESLTRPDSDLANLSGAGNFLIADISGRGQYVGTILAIDSPSPFWNGEGDDMFFIDGKTWPPQLHGTGTEDYINTAWCPREKWNGAHHGLILSAHPHGQPFLGKTTFYRFHTADPIQFEKSLHVSIEHGTGNEFVGDWSATSFWYALDRKSPLADLPVKSQRVPLPALAVEVGAIVEQSHKSLSYFFQVGERTVGNRLIDVMESLWRGGHFDLSAAMKWNDSLWSALADARRKYCQREGKIVRLKNNAEVEIPIDRIHGSHTAAPRSGKVWLTHDGNSLLIKGSFEIERLEPSPFRYDKIDFMIAPQDQEEAYVMIGITPDLKNATLHIHAPNNWKPWDQMTLMDSQIPVTVKINAANWEFSLKVSWEQLGIKTPVVGSKMSLNIDRWNHAGGAWWASWAITPHHFYPPQVGGLMVFE